MSEMSKEEVLEYIDYAEKLLKDLCPLPPEVVFQTLATLNSRGISSPGFASKAIPILTVFFTSAGDCFDFTKLVSGVRSRIEKFGREDGYAYKLLGEEPEETNEAARRLMRSYLNCTIGVSGDDDLFEVITLSYAKMDLRDTATRGSIFTVVDSVLAECAAQAKNDPRVEMKVTEALAGAALRQMDLMRQKNEEMPESGNA